MAAAQIYTVLHTFHGGKSGAEPYAGLVKVGNALFGTAETGDASNNGIVYTVNLSTGTEKLLHAFAGGKDGAGPASNLIEVGSLLYGTTVSGGAFGKGTIFSINPASGAEQVVYSFGATNDGVNPVGNLIPAGASIYGVTASGGAANNGAVFAWTPSSGAEQVVYAFRGGSDGNSPQAGLIDLNGTLYGTTAYGGSSSNGTVYELNPDTGG